MAPRIVGGSSYTDPSAPKTLRDTCFDAFDPTRKNSSAQEAKGDPVAKIMAGFEEAQRRQREPRPRKGVQ